MKTLIFDIETSPIIIPTFGLYGEKTGNHKDILQDWFVISVAWKWLGKKRVEAVSIIDDEERFSIDNYDDFHVVSTFHKVLMEADMIVGHNVQSFDWKKLNSRFIKHGLDPIPKKKIADTYRIAKREFNFTSNRLDYIAEFLGLGGKMVTPKGMWIEVMRGNKDAVKTMVKYNKQDVVISEKVFLALRPYDTKAVNVRAGKLDIGCPKCGSSNYISNGHRYTVSGKTAKYQCVDCRGSFAETTAIQKGKNLVAQ